MMKDLYLIHSGVGHDDDPPGRGSGRFAWGSGENPHQHQFNFLSEVNRLRKQGIKDAEIAKMLIGAKAYLKDGTPIWANTTDLRAEIAIEKKKETQFNIERAMKLYDECGGNVSEVGRRMGRNESTIRSWLDPALKERASKYEATANMIKDVIERNKDNDSKGMIDVSKYSELYLGVTDSTKKVALAMLEKEGYIIAKTNVPQVGTQHETTMLVIAPPGTSWGDIQKNKLNVKPIQEFTPDEGKTWWTPEFPESLDSKRIMIRYAEEGGKDKDGVIELRRGVEDISLGGSQYAQVRIAVDGTNYMKGMAMYTDDIPKGYDVIYNTNKKSGTPMIDPDAKYVLNEKTGEYSWTGKEILKRMNIDNRTMEVDRENPFGALIKSPKERDGIITAGGQRHYIDKDGKEKLSPINKLQDEGDWDSWSRNLSSQFLSKQPLKLINQQIEISLADKRNELDEIMRLTNPVIKKKLLEDYAANCDSNAADLSVKGFKNQAFQVILPITDMKSNECYAPNYDDGDTVALIRYPHGGTFEIPILKVNNRQATAKKVMQDAHDAIGINAKVAEQLSGADFDGDTALVIPLKSNRLAVTSTKIELLPGLKGFDPKELYKLPDDAPQMKSQTKQTEMGKVTNLITDMTVGGASWSEISNAVKHSMVVIDAEKHHLDYKRSAKDNNIEALKKEYQGINEETGKVKGASTILSKAKSIARISKRKEITDVSKMTPEQLKRWNEGKRVFIESGEKKKERITDPSKMTPDERILYEAGKKVYRVSDKDRQEEVHWMDVVDDARELVRDKTNKKEMAYADYANSLKDLANEARREARSIKSTPVNLSAKKTYAKEVESLNRSLRIAQMNNPRERQAQVIANNIASERIKSNPEMDYQHKQRERARALTEARAIVGAKKEKIKISDREWEAIQANAISTNKLFQIILNTDQDAFKQRATPKQERGLTSSQISLALSMYNSGMYTQKEIADKFGVSASTISNAIKNN